MESSFVADSPDYWNLDLRRLTWCGWLLMLLAVVTLFGAALAAAEPLLWSPARTRSAGASGAVRKQAVLHGPDSRPIGTFYEVA